MQCRPAAALAGAVGAEGSRTENAFTFYLGTHEPSWLASMDIPLFISYSRLARRRSLPRARAPWAQDGNGFTVLQDHGRYLEAPAAYARATERHQQEISLLDFASIQDWMCEPIIISGGRVGNQVFVGTKLSIAEHQARTVRSYLELRELAPGVPWLPVLQGWHLDSYLCCAELYDRAGVDLAAAPRVGVGSVCRRQRTGEAAHIFSALASLGYRLHAFGVKSLGLKRYAGSLASADSLAWSYNARRHPAMDGCTHKNCSNCRRWALRWRANALDGLATTTQQLALAL